MTQQTPVAFVVSLFEHTSAGEATLHALLKDGVPSAAVSVIGDLGAPAGQPEAERHVTFDSVHLPAELRGLFMDTVRDGGVVLAVDAQAMSRDEVERHARQQGVLRVIEVASALPNPSHNVTH